MPARALYITKVEARSRSNKSSFPRGIEQVSKCLPHLTGILWFFRSYTQKRVTISSQPLGPLQDGGTTFAQRIGRQTETP